MKKITGMIILTIVFCYLWSVSMLRAAEPVWDSKSYLMEWLFLIFCGMVVVFMVTVIRTVIAHTPKRQRKDMLQRCFYKWLAH